jgi:hypothetical protein
MLLTLYTIAKFEAFTAVKIQVEVFGVLMPYSVVVGYQLFGGLSYHSTTRHHNPEDLDLNYTPLLFVVLFKNSRSEERNLIKFDIKRKKYLTCNIWYQVFLQGKLSQQFRWEWLTLISGRVYRRVHSIGGWVPAVRIMTHYFFLK